MATRAGIALDGTTATVVLAHDSGDTLAVETLRTFEGPTVAEQLRQATALLRPGDPVRVALVLPNTAAATLTGSRELLARAYFTRAALDATSSGDGVAVAGRLASPDAAGKGRITTSLATTAPADALADVHAVLRGAHPHEVTTTALTHGPIDGASLALNRAHASVVLVADGAPVAAAILRAGGLDRLTTTLGGDRERTRAALTGNAPDPIAAAEVTRWLRDVGEETRNVLTGFARSGLPASTTVFVHGPGGTAAALSAVLADAGLTRRDHPILRSIPGAPDDRPAAVAAYLAAATLGDGLPHAAFVDPVELAAARRAAVTAARRRTTARVTAAAALVLAAALGPHTYAAVTTWRAEQDLAAARTEVLTGQGRADRADLVALTELRAALSDPNRDASTATAAAVTAARAGVVISAVSVEAAPAAQTPGTGRVVQVTATAPTLKAATSWVRDTRTALTRSGHTATITPTRVVTSGDGVQMTVSITARRAPAPPATTSPDEHTGKRP